MVRRFGRIDILVNNAGVMPLGGFLDEDDALSATTLDVNVWGLIHGLRLVLPAMIERGSGHVVNVASSGGGPYLLAQLRIAGVSLGADFFKGRQDAGWHRAPANQPERPLSLH